MADLDSKLIYKILRTRSVPSYIQSEYPKFTAFIDAWLQWMEQSKNPIDVSKNLTNYRDIDNTLDGFVEYFMREILVNIPADVLADKRLLAKNIKNFYLNKGNEDSYKFLFRILYDETIDFYYPKTDILRASDGKWFEEKSIKISLTDSDNILYMSSKLITGATSGATAIVESVLNYTTRGENIVELSLSDIKGTFVVGENITITYLDDDGATQTITETILNTYTGITINDVGSTYAVGDTVIIRDSGSTEIGRGEVYKVSKSPITSLTITNAGTGYNGNIHNITRFGALPMDWTFVDSNGSDYLPDTPADGSGSNSTGTDYTAFTFNETVALQAVPGTGDVISISDSDTSFGYGASGVVATVDDDGAIVTATLLEGGGDYESATATVISETGTGAIITPVGGGGAIASAILTTFPLALDSEIDSNGVSSASPDFTAEGDGLATGTLVQGALGEYPGRYLNEDGQLSASKKLQDSTYYQDYSYVIKVGLSLRDWKDKIKKIIHPAGIALFGEVQITTEYDATVTIDGCCQTRTITQDLNNSGMSLEENVIKFYSHDSNGDPTVPVLDSNGNHLLDWEKDSSGEYVQT